jgi:hypothetical protein
MILDCDRVPVMLLVFNNLSKEMAMTTGIGGPFLQTAVFCERVLDEKDGVISVVRIIDRMTVTASGEQAPERMPKVNLSVTLLVRFKSGDASGRYELKVKPISPSGKELPTFTMPFMLGGGELSANMILGYSVNFEEPGLYWFEIMLGELLYTKVSLNLIYERKPKVTTSSSPVQQPTT